MMMGKVMGNPGNMRQAVYFNVSLDNMKKEVMITITCTAEIEAKL